VRSRREISVKLPAGVGDGMRVRLAAQGEVGPGGGPAGDLYVEVHEQAHEVFLRDGDDLHCTLSVPMVDAALGTSVSVEAILDGPTEFTVAAGNDLVTPRPEWGFPGLVEGDRWCLCASRWLEAAREGRAPPVVLEATHEKSLDIVPFELLKKHAAPAG
jgi:molecular chaperone DnaJ